MSSAGAVTFVYANWIARYPEFTAVGAPAAQMYFNEATLYCANVTGLIPTVAQLTALLYMVTAHIAALNSPTTVAGANPLTPVGRVSSATEGSVTANFEASQPEAGSKDWFLQTKYGFAYWQATVQFRSFQYAPGPQRFNRRSRLC